MKQKRHELGRPIRVVLFGAGPTLERGIKQFICRLEEHPEIVFLGGFFESGAQTVWAVLKDLWQRRRFLAVPLMLIRVADGAGRFLNQRDAEIELKRKIALVSEHIHYVPDIHAEEIINRVYSMAPDLGLIYGSPILKPALFQIPTFGTLGIHHGKLPEYRGKKTTFWAMYNGEKTAGVTIQRVNAGLDTGEIVKEGEVHIGRRGQQAVWNELEKMGLDLYIEAILEVKKGIASYQPWLGEKGKLYHDPRLSDLLTFWLRRFRGLQDRSRFIF